MKKIILVATMLLFSCAAFAESPPIYQTDGIAINGYDPVAYVDFITAKQGKEEFSTEWMAVTWLFSNEENLEKFLADPEKYTPQYGGYCAYAVAQNGLATTDPNAFVIYKGKLYLNYDQFVSRLWRQGMTRFIEKADENWPDVLSTNTFAQ